MARRGLRESVHRDSTAPRFVALLVSTMFAHALVIMMMAHAHGDISGNIINPTTTLSLFLAGALDRVRILPFMVVQLADGIVDGWIVQFAFGDMAAMSGVASVYGATLIADGVSVPAAFLLKIIGTFLLVNSILPQGNRILI